MFSWVSMPGFTPGHSEGLLRKWMFCQEDRYPPAGARWLNVVSSDDPNGSALLLEPDGSHAVRPFKKSLVSDGIPLTCHVVAISASHFEPLSSLGGRFIQSFWRWGRWRLRGSTTRAATPIRSLSIQRPSALSFASAVYDLVGLSRFTDHDGSDTWLRF